MGSICYSWDDTPYSWFETPFTWAEGCVIQKIVSSFIGPPKKGIVRTKDRERRGIKGEINKLEKEEITPLKEMLEKSASRIDSDPVKHSEK